VGPRSGHDNSWLGVAETQLIVSECSASTDARIGLLTLRRVQAPPRLDWFRVLVWPGQRRSLTRQLLGPTMLCAIGV
jgi:hypothetical protein